MDSYSNSDLDGNTEEQEEVSYKITGSCNGFSETIDQPTTSSYADDGGLSFHLMTGALSNTSGQEKYSNAFSSVLLQPVHIQLPSFRNVQLKDLPPAITDVLCDFLDRPAIGSSLLNWQTLAFKLGLSSTEIQHIQERHVYPASGTLQVLWRFPNRTLDSLLSRIMDDLHRIDVLVAVLPLIHQQFNNSVPSLPAIPNASMSKQVDILVIGLLAADPETLKYGRWLCANLTKHSAVVHRDDKIGLRASGAGQDPISYATQIFAKVQQIIIVLSNGYCALVGRHTDHASSVIGVEQVLSIHLHSLMQSEYSQNSCINYRFRAVRFAFCDLNSLNMPVYLRNSLVFNWPTQQPALFTLLFEQPQHSEEQPANGGGLSSVDSGLQSQSNVT